MNVIMKGSTSILLDEMDIHKTSYWSLKDSHNNSNDILYKVVTSKELFGKEIENAIILYKVDKNQEYYVYPHKGYILNRNDICKNDLLKLRTKYDEKVHKHFDINANIFYVLEMNYGGMTMYELNKYGIRIESTIKNQIISGLRKGLKSLHDIGMVHGDSHIDNIVFTTKNNQVTNARWIDFANMEMSTFTKGDLYFFNKVISIITNI